MFHRPRLSDRSGFGGGGAGGAGGGAKFRIWICSLSLLLTDERNSVEGQIPVKKTTFLSLSLFCIL